MATCTPVARAAITLSLVLLGEGSAAEQMRDSGKIITTARQDELDKLSEGINFAFSRQFATLRQHWQHALFSLLVMQLTAFGIGEPQPSLTGVASYSPQGVTTCVLTDSPLHTSHHCVLCSQCTVLLMRPHILHQKRPHPPSRHTTAQHTPFTPFTPFTRMHPPHTLASCMNPTAELMQVEISGGSTKVGGNTTADDTPSCVPDAVAHLVSVFQGDNSNLLPFITPRQPKLPCRSTTHCSHTATATTTTNPHAADVGEQPAVLEAARPNAGHLYR